METTRAERLLFLKHFERAQGWLLLDKPKEALAALALVPEVFRARPEFLTVYGHAFQTAEKWAEAEKIFRVLITLSADEPQHWISLAYATRRAHSISEAELILVEARRRFPQVALIAFNLACYAAQLGNLERARHLLRDALVLEPELKVLAASDPDLAPLRAA